MRFKTFASLSFVSRRKAFPSRLFSSLVTARHCVAVVDSSPKASVSASRETDTEGSRVVKSPEALGPVSRRKPRRPSLVFFFGKLRVSSVPWHIVRGAATQARRYASAGSAISALVTISSLFIAVLVVVTACVGVPESMAGESAVASEGKPFGIEKFTMEATEATEVTVDGLGHYTFFNRPASPQFTHAGGIRGG